MLQARQEMFELLEMKNPGEHFVQLVFETHYKQLLIRLLQLMQLLKTVALTGK